jgi:hypothetical protein
VSDGNSYVLNKYKDANLFLLVFDVVVQFEFPLLHRVPTAS